MTIIQYESGGVIKYISVPSPSEAEVESQDRIPHPPRRNLQKNLTQSSMLEPIERSDIARLGDRIVDECPLAAPAFVGPIRLVVGLAILVFAGFIALGAYVSCKKELLKEWHFTLQRAFDEATRGVLECLLFPILWRDRDRNTSELNSGKIRGGEAYGDFMYKGPGDSIMYSKEKFDGAVTWELDSDDEWVGKVHQASFRGRVREQQMACRNKSPAWALPSHSTVVSD